MAYGKYKDLTKRTKSDKVFRNRVFKTTTISKHDEYERGSASIVYKFLEKKSTGSGIKSMSIKSIKSATCT